MSQITKNKIVCLAPMDGITDTAFRQIVKKYGNPNLMFTEFVNVMGLCIAGENLLPTLYYEEMERPLITQLFGKEPDYFYHAAKIVCALGFDGVDINMGCPARTVAGRGAGAGLIQTPGLALEIIKEAKRGVADWVQDGLLTGLKPKTLKTVEKIRENFQQRLTHLNNAATITDDLTPKDLNLKPLNLNLTTGIQNLSSTRREIPVSVKTRIGYDKPITESWIRTLSQANPAWISLHGRTFKQMYSGKADWGEIKKGVECTSIPIIANGDINEYEDIQKVLAFTGAVGVMIGRGALGNPEIFQNPKKQKAKNKEILDELELLLEHVELFVKYNPNPKSFVQMRKHFGWYIKGFDGAKELRERMMKVENLHEVRELVGSYLVN